MPSTDQQPRRDPPPPPLAAAARPAGRAPAGHVVVVGNLKGGSGKSTLAVNLAAAMAAAGRRVALMDCDPQGSVALWAARGRAPVKVFAEPLARLDAAPGWLARADWLRSGRDALVVDLPAVAAPAMAASFMIASLILVPASPSSVDVEGTRRVLALLAAAARERGPGRSPRTLLVPTRVRELEGGLGGDWRAGLAGLGLPMAPPLGHHSEFDAAFARGSWVGDGFRRSRAAQELGRVAERVLHELELAGPAAAAVVVPEPAAAASPPWWWRRLLPLLGGGGLPTDGGRPLRAASAAA